MSKAITKDYLIRQLHNFEDDVLDEKYLQLTKVIVNNEPVVPDPTNHTISIEIPDGIQYSVAKKSTPTTGYFATYTLQSRNGDSGTWADVVGAEPIDIPKDYLVKSGEVKTVTAADKAAGGIFENDPDFLEGDKYIDFVVNVKEGTATDEHLYINVKDLVDVYTAGDGIGIDSNNEISVTPKTNGGVTVDSTGVSVALKNDGGLAVDANGVYIDFEDVDIDFNTEYLSV